jgi:sporulation protein YlmC with PRC-barrel domain
MGQGVPAISSGAMQAQRLKLTQAHRDIGRAVVTADNKNAGRIADLVVDFTSGHVLYAVVRTAQGSVAVAPGVFTGLAPGTARVNVTQQKLDGAPKFISAIAQPGQIDRANFVSQVYQYFGQYAWWQGATPASSGTFQNVHRASQMRGMKIEDVNNAKIGSLNRLIVNLPAGQVVYVVMTPAPRLKLGNNLYLLPPQAVSWNATQNSFVSNVNRQKLVAAPHVAANRWPGQITSPAFAMQVYRYYGKQAPNFQTGGALQPTGRTAPQTYPR